MGVHKAIAGSVCATARALIVAGDVLQARRDHADAMVEAMEARWARNRAARNVSAAPTSAGDQAPENLT